MNKKKLLKAVKLQLEALDCDLESDNYKQTPERVLRFYEELFGPKRDNFTEFEETYDETVILRDHQLWTLCPHHLLPVRLDVCLGYIPNGSVLGLSKLARVVDSFNRSPLLQEDLTRKIVDWFVDHEQLQSKGAACLVRGWHLCMTMRGVKSRGDVITTAFRGLFATEEHLQAQFLQLVEGSR